MSHEKTFKRQKQFVMPTYSPSKLLVRGAGCRVWDSEGREYLDFAAGISVCNLGHCHPGVTAAIAEQAAKLVHVSNLYINENQPALAEMLCDQGFDGAVFFSNSGAEANEGMIKFARRHGNADGKTKIITMDGSFHGRTLSTLAATGQTKYRLGFEPEMPGFGHVPFNDIDALTAAVDDRTAAVMLEPIQGEGGVMPADPAYLAAVRKLCDDKGVLLLFDEVQCGMGRTGSFFAWQNYGIEPDALSLAKALGNGFPIGCFMVARRHAGVLSAGTHASTFGGSPLACAASLAVLRAFENENVLANCREMAESLRAGLEEMAAGYDFVAGVRGMGLMLGVVMSDGDTAARAVSALDAAGMLALTAGGNVLRLLPPLNIGENEVEEALAIIAAVFAAIAAEKEKDAGNA